jgi:hypothetical protein
VPRVYLRNFAVATRGDNAPKQLYVLNLDNGDEFTSSVDKLFVEKHLYTIAKNEQDPSYALEDALSQIESLAAPGLKALAAGKAAHCDVRQRIYLSYFFASLLTRNPRMITTYQHGLSSAANEPEAELPPQLRGRKYREEAKILNDWYSSLDTEGKRHVFLKSILDSVDGVAADLRAKSWSLFQAIQNTFVSSDEPIVIYHPSEKSYGVATPGISLHVAVSPEILLMLGDSPVKDESALYPVPSKMVQSINCMTASRAKRFAVSSVPFNGMKDELLATRG